MVLTTDCQRCIDDAMIIYDFMSMAMEQIYSINPDFVDLANGINSNEKLKNFIEDVKTELFNSVKGRFFIFPEAKKGLMELIDDIDFLTDKDSKCSALVLYAILLSIDSEFKYDNNHDELGPLDSDLNHRFKLYRFIPNTLIDPFIVASGKERVGGSSVCRNFENFSFLDLDAWGKDKAVPIGYAVDSPMSDDFKRPNHRPIRVGVSLFCSQKNFDFVSDVSKDLTIDYSSKNQERFIKMVDKLLDKAISNKCDFLILPEYHTSPEVLDHIEKCLKKASEKGRNIPTLTFAGSQWTADNSNQMTVFVKDGKIKKLYNKYSPYIGEVKTTQLKNRSGKKWDTDKLKVTEKLNNRDENLYFFGIDNVGTILPSICRDAYDDDYTQVLAQNLHPLFVFISSWSTSLNSFRSPLRNLCSRYFVSSVLDNACSAIAQKRKVVGYCNTVHKPKTVPAEKTEEFKRPCTACENCDSGCLYIAEYDFGHHIDDGTPDGKFIQPTLTVNCFVTDK